MHWNRMLLWMGAVLLLACILIARRSVGQPVHGVHAAPSPVVAEQLVLRTAGINPFPENRL
jgi:hypothetical protein